MIAKSEVAAYLRVSSLAIALFDFVQTLPGEYRLYSQQSSFRRLSPACILFILVRYISVAALITSSIGFFGDDFSTSSCRHFFLVAPVLKLLATLVSQGIISIRTYAVARKSRWVFWTLVAFFFLTLVPEVLGNVVRRIMVQNANHNCTSGNLPGAKIAWLHYLAAMIFDACATTITTYFLFSSASGLTMMGGFSRMMLEEGLVYFVALTGFNVLNVILFRSNDFALQSSGATLGQAITMIFSQKLILKLSDSAFERSSREKNSRNLSRDAARGEAHARSAFVRSFSRGTKAYHGDSATVELGIRVEKEVEINMDDLSPFDETPSSRSHAESFSKSRAVTWEEH